MDKQPLVYIVDDEESIRESLKMLLLTLNYNVTCFKSAQEFLDKCDFTRPACLLVDVFMPKISGLELLNIVLAKKANMPVILMTGFCDQATQTQAIHAGALGFIEKPFGKDRLLHMLQLCADIHSKTKISQW